MSSFDYIIIGAGSAGCVLASRLSENPDNKVLLLEAGGKDSNFLIHMPAGVGKLIGTDLVNWYYYTEGQTNLNNRKLFWPRGKVLGGSSSINGMIYIRGHARDYDLWRQLGLEGWGFADVCCPISSAPKATRTATAPFTAARGRSASPMRARRAFSSILCRGGQAGWPSLHGRFQWPATGRRRPLSDHDQERQAVQRRGRISGARAQSP